MALLGLDADGILEGKIDIFTKAASVVCIDVICQVTNCLVSLQQGKIIPLMVLKCTATKACLFGLGTTTTEMMGKGLLVDSTVSDTIVGIKLSGPHLFAKGKNGFYAWCHNGDEDFGKCVEVLWKVGEAYAIIKDAKGAAVVGFDSWNLASPNHHGELHKVVLTKDKELAIASKKEEKMVLPPQELNPSQSPWSARPCLCLGPKGIG